MNPCIECRNCKQELQPSFKHCPICGESVIQETVVSCPNYKNGKPCGRTLKPASKFCGGCRWKVHPKIFIPGTKVCGVENDGTVCINIIEPDEDFCTECGTDVQRRIDTEDVDMEDVSADIDSSLSANKEDQPLFEQKVQYMVQPAKSEYGDDTTANKNLFSEHREESKKQHQEITTDFEDMSTNLGNIAVSNQQDTSHVDSSVIELERNNSIGTFVSSDQNLSASIRETTLESQNGLQKDAQDAEEDLKGKMVKHESSVDHTCGIGRDDGTSLGSTIGLNGTKVFPDSTTDPTCTTGPDVALTGTSENTGTNSTIDPIDTKGTDGTMSGNDDTTGTKGNTDPIDTKGTDVTMSGIDDTTGTKGNTDPTDTKGTDGTTGIDDTTGTKGNTDPTDTKGTDGTMSGNDDTTGTKGNTDPIDTKGTDGTMSGNYDTTGTKGNTDPIDTKGTDGTMSGIDDTTGTKGNTDPTDTKGTDGTTGIDNTKGTKGNTDPTDTKGTDDTTGTDSTTGHTSTKDHVGTKDSNGNASVSSFKETDKVDNKNPPSSNGATPDTPVTMNNGSEPKAYGATPDSIDNEKAPIRCTSSDESDNASTDESDAESVQSNPSENPANQKTTGISKPKHKKMTGKEKRKADYEKKKERQSEKEKLKGKENMEAFDLKDQPQKKKDSLKKSLNGTSHEDKGADTSPGKGKQGDILETKHDGQETQKQNEKHGSNEKDKKKNSNPSEKESKSNTRKAHGGRGRQHTTVDVHFHAIASKKFLPKPDECKIYIRIHHADFGNGDLSHPMQIKRNLGKDGHEVYALIKVPQYMIKNGDAISYRYTVVEKGNTENKEDEFYYMNGKKHLRKILLSEDRRKKDVDFWHQYDGVIRKSPDNSKWKQFTDYFRGNTYEDSLKGDAELTITTFLPGLCSLSETVEKSCSPKEGFDIMEMLHCGIKTNYHYTTKIWFSLRDMTKFIGEVVYGCLKKSRKWSEIESGKSSEFVSAACVLLLHHKLDMDLSEAEKVGLCKCLHIVINPTEKQCPTWETFLQYFEELKSEVKPALHNLLRIGGETRDPGWLHCVPLWHFLSGKCKPFEDIPKDCTHDAPTPKWWGIDDLSKEIDFFKAKTHWTMSAANMAGILRPTFQADYLMSRTFVAVLKFENLDEIFKTRFFPPEVLLASLYYHLKTHNYIQGSKKQSFMSLFHHLNDQLRDYQQKAESSIGECSLFNQSFICQKIGCDIVFLCLDNTWTYDKDLTCLAIVCCMLSLNYFNLCCKMRAEETKEKNKQPDKSHINRLDHIKKRILRWLKEKNSFFYNAKNELKIWNNIASVDFTNGVIIDCWKKEILKALEDTLTEKCMEKELMGLYCTDLDDFSKDVQAILSRVTLKALEKGAKLDLNLMNLNQALEYGRMLSQLLERNWPTSQDPTGILKFTLTWPPLIDFLRIFYDNVDKLQILSAVCHSHLSNAANVLKKTLEILTNGNIRMAEFNIVQKNVTVFIEACRKLKIVDIKGQQLEEHVTKLVQIRDTEFRTFQEMHVHVSNLIALCQHFEVNTGRLDQVMLDLQPVETVPLSSLCLPGDVTRILALDTYTPDIRVFELSDEQLEKCKSLSSDCRSTTFMNIWINRGQRASAFRKRKLTMDEVFTEVMELCYQEWNQLANQLRQGKIRFSSFRKYFKQTDHKFLEDELHAMSINGETDWIYERLKQIGQHSTIRQCSRGARVILEVVDRYGLTGNFKQIRQILSLEEGEDTEMCEIDESLMKACSVLKGMNEENIKSLETFIKCKPLVDWLRSAMKTGLRELKVFVELASISAGEGDMEVAKVNLLHSATTGYSPLIFNLDERCDSKIFLEKCQVVWRELESDPYLPRKLEDVLRQLEWLKTVRKAHGSVEISSMRQAEAINSKGIYCVGKLHKFRDIQNKKMSLDEVLQLMVHEEEEGKQLKREYQYKELNELQSKLMLVAGKAEQGKADVDMFTMVYDSIIRLCKVYIKLTSAGCVLYKDWHVQFLCDQKRPVCAFVKFGHGQTCNQLKGRRTETNDIDKIVPRLAKFMEKCLEEWMTYIDSKREEYIYLNYFTIDQLVILQRELVKLSEDSEPSKHVYPLLCAVKKNCTKADLIAAMRLAKQEVTKMENVRHEQTEADKDAASYSPQTNANVMKFVEEMEKVGYRKEIALAALEFCKPDEIDEGLVWCMEHESDIAVTQPHSSDDPSTGTNIQAEENFKGWTVSPQSMFSVTQDILQSVSVPDYMCEPDEDPLIQRLQAVWEKFLNSVSSSVSDYLSVEHLGLILSKLAATETFSVKRTLMSCFETSQPNLLICPQGDILNTVLTIYASDQNQPLPQSHEVLLCTPHTTLDEVDIFWRRALFNSQGNIHCMVNGDCLDYEVSDEGEKRLELYMINAKEKGVHYRLVVLCSSELEYRSRMVAALDRYKRDPLPLLRTDEIRDYILDKLKSQTQNRNIPAAAAIDFEKSCVRVVKSWRSGVGKSLYKLRMSEEVKRMKTTNRQTEAVVSLPLHERKINTDNVVDKLTKHTLPAGCMEPRLFHIDIYHEVDEGLDTFLFQLLVLGCLTDSSGFVWIKLPCDLYVVETMPILAKENSLQKGHFKCKHRCFDILPDVVCRSPTESLEIMMGVNRPQDFSPHDLLFDEKEFRGSVFQRPYQYLVRLDAGRGLADVDPAKTEGDRNQCLQVLLRHCGIEDPSWSELKHFVWFLNNQLLDFEVSAFCSLAAVEDLPGFAQFVLRFLIQMSRDFATRSLNMSEESPVQLLEKDEEQEGEKILDLYQLRRTWESSPHPYLFFNPDHHSMTFMGFFINPKSGDLIDQQTKQPLERGIMKKNLFDALQRNHVNLNEDFDSLPRDKKIEKLCSVMGIEHPYDPDSTYELTTDNVKKMLAIYMRFRCDIPVIIMGETGCGKTRLIKFMCSLQSPPGVEAKNMVLMKVHGGTTSADIVRKVHRAEIIAKENTQNIKHNMYTVLFFDEANTTEAIGIIKEIMCDRSINGIPLKISNNLKIVAACNPYRKHSEKLIRRLEQAGLGYHVDADKTTDKMGRVPMRRLVYRVQPLPQSMLPLVWDFGQLNTDVEEIYIRQMVLRFVNSGRLPSVAGIEKNISKILTVSQNFMRQLKDECSFVSLRDVERVLEVMSWFYNQTTGEHMTPLFRLMNRDQIDDTEEENDTQEEEIDNITRSLLLALGVCYHACLKNREQYRKAVCPHFTGLLNIPGQHNTEKAERMLEVIIRCQDAFLDNVQLGQNIARNQALKENVFMMVVCVELRIPLFLVGKPGSSKSLAKTIVADAMQGNAAHTDLFKAYKQVQMVSFQCSPLSVPEGIVGTFRQCARYQIEKDLGRFVSVVVLDEIGLAEDSPKMPLKTLHPLLEDGCQGDEEPAPHKKVAFIGISNWALDPAKMNRGILVQREVPDLKELEESAEGICSENKYVLTLIKHLVEPMAKSYLQLFEKVLKKREFFGLRDFYSLLKMVYGFADAHKQMPSWAMLKHAILRNFGGFEGIDPVKEFEKHLASVKSKQQLPGDPDCTPSGLIQACLHGHQNSESRYLLLLTENYGALSVLQQKIHTMKNAITIFGSSFPSDQEYTQVCRNINRIKVCMETGKTVVLLNLENLYESLYDALNQYYVYFGGERYVDLGLGTHRVKCRVHKEFRLIVVAEKEMVYDKFPIPLINRLEKHFLTITNMLSEEQLEITAKLEKWAEDFVKVNIPMYQMAERKKQTLTKVEEVFMGFHADTCASIILHVCNSTGIETQGMKALTNEILEDAKRVLLWCATPDSVLRLKDTKLSTEAEKLEKIYFKEQKHGSLIHYLAFRMKEDKLEGHTEMESIFVQVTTSSKLLSTADIGEIANYLKLPKSSITILTLQSFDTEQQFCRQVRASLEQHVEEETLLIVQCDSGDLNAALIACARYSVYDELQKIESSMRGRIYIVFIVQLPSIAAGNFNGFQCGLWHSIHLDELRPQEKNIPDIMDMRNKGVASLMKVSDKAELTEKQHSEDWRQENSNFVPREIDDFEEDIVTMDEHLNAGQVPVERHFDIGTLIRACVQPSLAMVKDVDSTSTRATERVKILLELIHERDISGNHQFLDGLCYHLAALMKEREDKQGYRGSDWLTKEATKPENIKRAGTFRKALKQCLIDKMTPVLAGLIAFIDTNMNLDILIHDKSWKQSLWLQMFLNTKATGIEYSRMLSPGNQEELREIFVKGTSSEGQMFVSLMPFSWLIHSVVDRVDKVADKVYQNEHALEEVERVASIVLEKPIGQKLSALSGQTCVEGIKAYLSDFVRIVYPVKSDEEHQLVCESLFNGCRQIVRIDLNSMVHAITAIHVTFRLYSTRLRYFSDINRVWADCSTKVKTVQQNSAQYYLISDDELTLDVLGLHLLLENLEPGKDALNGKPGRALWLRKVHLYRPVVERILGNFKVEINDASSTFGKRCREGIFKARLQWSRVVIMKLFIEHVCASDEQDVKRIMPLWVMFKDGADMKTVASLNKIERVLTIMNKETVKYIYGKQEKCHSCETDIENVRPIQLPCLDVICNRCYEELMMMKSGECPVCYSPIPAEFIPSSDDSKRKIADGKYMEYRKRCNAFFMEVVSQLCFSEDMAPEPELIQKLMSYIIRQSKKGRGRVFTNEMTVFEDGLDPTPVFRSFLLQLLIRSSSEQVDQYLDQYFRQAQEIISGTPGETNQQVTELSLLIIQCLEDSLRQEVCRKADVTSEEIQEATKALRQNINHIMVEELHINKLYSLAEVRFGLTVVAKYLHKNVSEKSTHMKVNVRRMMDVAATLFDNCGFNSPKLFLIKQLCRCYGIERYYAVCNNSGPAVARWMTMPELSSNDKVVECPDRFIVNGNVYMQIRDKLTQTLLTQDVKLLENFLQSLHIPEWEVRVHLLLAIFKEVTMINIHPPDKRRTSQQTVDAMISEVSKLPLLHGQDPLMKMLTSSSPWTQLPMLGITERMDLGVQNIVSLLVHFLVVILQLPSNQSFIEPLRCLSVQPQIMKNALLPTMHQDDVAEIHEALLAARRDFPNENPVLYRCPNGHPYIIGDCGRPATVGRCKECHQEIGGTGYQLKQGNVQDQGLDQTQTGHILGQPENRSTNPVPERTMSPSQCSIIRLLTHLALFTGATTNPQAISELINPNIQPLDVSTFLYRHIYVDLQCIQNALGCNLDDVYLLLHFILYNLQARHHMYENQRPEVLNLLKKDGRSSWETGFVKVYLDDILKNKDNILKKLNQGIMEDKRLGSDPLLCLLFEKDTPLQNVPATQLHNHPAVWRYRTEISVKHLQQEFLSQKTPASFPLLHNFLQEDQHLRAIRYVPSIIKLQQRLIQRYQRKLDRMEANKMIVQDILEDKDGDTIDTERLLQDFMEAWECVRERLVNFNVPVDSTKTTLPPSYCQPITMRSPLSQLLPTHRDAGLCSYVLLYFLLYKQNKFLQEYCQQTKTRYDGLPRVTLGELSPAHLIMYHPDRDIYPMLLANCSYSFEVGKGTRIEYNYHDFERQLADRFFFSKSVIKIAVEEFDLMVYRSESTNATSFKRLRERMLQEQLNSGVRHQIREEFRSYEEVCESLDRLDIAISFLKSDNVEPDTPLDQYLSHTLRMEYSFPSQKVKQTCRCKHVQSLWLTLAQLKTTYQTCYRQESFENISKEFRKDLTDNQRSMVETFTVDLIPERLAVILDILFECIVLTISIPQNPDDDDYRDMTKQSLRDELIGYLTSLPYEGYIEYELHQDWLEEMIGQIPGNSDDTSRILTEQSVDMWLLLHAIYIQKSKGR